MLDWPHVSTAAMLCALWTFSLPMLRALHSARALLCVPRQSTEELEELRIAMEEMV
jgi:hypothetical protein